MPLNVKTELTLHPAQQEIMDDGSRFRIVICGRRFGKTTLSIELLVQRMLRGFPTAYFTPTYKMNREVWRAVKNRLGENITYKNETEQRIEIGTAGGSVDFWSLERADTVRGRGYQFIVVDEAAMIPSGAIWAEVLLPLLTDNRGGAVFTTTPKGYNWVYDLYKKGIDPTFPEWKAWHFPTAANPGIDPLELTEIQRLVPERVYRQEYQAEFLDDAGGVFRGVDAISTLPAREPYAGKFVFGVDWARQVDFTVISILDANTQQQVALDRFHQIGWEVQKGRLLNLFNQWKPTRILAEENSIGSPLIESLQQQGLPIMPFQTTSTSKSTLIDALSLAIEQQELALLDDAVQKAELKSYQMQRLKSGVYRYTAPADGHDDTVIALALAWRALGLGRRMLFNTDETL